MAGCFGNSSEDRYRERELDRYLSSTDGEGLCECGEEGQETCADCREPVCTSCAEYIGLKAYCKTCAEKRRCDECLEIAEVLMYCPDNGWAYCQKCSASGVCPDDGKHHLIDAKAYAEILKQRKTA